MDVSMRRPPTWRDKGRVFVDMRVSGVWWEACVAGVGEEAARVGTTAHHKRNACYLLGAGGVLRTMGANRQRLRGGAGRERGGV